MQPAELPAGEMSRPTGGGSAGPMSCGSSRFRSVADRVHRVRPVLNFEGQLLPVEDREDSGRAQGMPEAKLIVVVCREGNRHVGIAVAHVLDVARGEALFEAGTDEPARRAITLLKSRVTGVVDLGV